MEGALDEVRQADNPAEPLSSTRPVRAARAAPQRGSRGRGARGGARGGRGRGRAHAPPPPPPPPPAESDSEDCSGSDSGSGSGSGSGSSGERSSGSSSEEDAQQQQHAAPAPVPPSAAQLTVQEQAIRLVMQSTGVARKEAELAVAESRGESEPQDADEWEDLAQLWLAERAAFEDERNLLAATMAASLAEAEKRKSAQLPLAERPPEQIAREFASSKLLPALARRRALASLLEPPLRQPLLDLLVLEQRCSRWWELSRHYWAATAERLASQLHDEVGAAEGADTADAPPPSKRRRVTAAAGGASGSGGPGLPGIGEEQAAVLAVALDCLREEVQAEAFAMPTGCASALPALFAAAVPEGAHQECVELLDSEDEAPGGRQQQRQRQQQAAG